MSDAGTKDISVHAHRHETVEGDAPLRSIVSLSALARLGSVALLIAALWAGVFWALR